MQHRKTDSPDLSRSLETLALSLPLLAAGWNHTCAFRPALADAGANSSSVFVCWGNNQAGQTAVNALPDVTLLTASRMVTCASTSKAVRCWGKTWHGGLRDWVGVDAAQGGLAAGVTCLSANVI